MKSISPKQISYIAAICLLFILVTQAFLVYDYFQTTRAGLVRESDAIIEESFKKDLEIRRKLFNESEIVLPPSSTALSTNKPTFYDFSKRSDYSNNIIGLVDLAINIHISKKVPISIQRLDSITGSVLNARGINTKYAVTMINPSTRKVLHQSKSNLISSSFFQVSSKYLTIDIVDNKALQLVLVNPFGIIIKRMGLMLLTSLVFSIICLLAFGYLKRILAKQKQLVAFKNDFLGTIAHELKRPVASLSFNLDCLSMPAFIENRHQHELLVIRSIDATAELNNTINMIVALAKVEEGLLTLNKEPINLCKLFEELRGKFVSCPVKKVDIQTVYETNDVSVTGDVNLLSQCFANLIDNAIKYSGNEVLIIITIRKTGHWIVVSIKDNGFGIPEEKLPVIFDKYSRVHTENTKINGFGIGLNYVKTIVEKHRGEVAVESHRGEGTEFSVLLPE
jgi:signal transduction histidine kinase